MKPSPTATLRDYSADSRILYVSVLAAGLGAISAVLAWALLEAIALSTNLFYFQRWSFVEVDPWQSHLGWWRVFLPVLGGLLVGLIARYGSPKVRGHGMPEAVETIVFNGGKVQPRVAILKPLATAISIGSGGPFGAEGPVIMTGGAVGSVLGQLLPMTDSERTVLMVSGAAAGMAATFNCPMSAVLLAVEILLFEWKPRSLVPVAMACVTAGAVRRLLLGPSPIFQMVPTGAPVYHMAMLGALVVGILAAFVAFGLSRAIHFSEEMFEHLPIHWMWWPAIGGLGVGLGGLIFPQALGVGYSVIQQMISGNAAWQLLAGILVVKSCIWIFSLGSNTAGGILAPLLMIGGALGAAVGHLMPAMSTGAWALVGMTAVLTAAIGSPLTAAMLAVELTHNGGLMLPVLLACVSAYAISVLILPRSMLTEGLSRKGKHLSREYGVDPLELVMVAQAMHTSVFALSASATRRDAFEWLRKMEERGAEAWSHWQRLFPLVEPDGTLAGLLTRTQMMQAARQADLDRALLHDANRRPATIAGTDTLRQAAVAMAESKLSHYPVVDPSNKFMGLLTIEDLLLGRSREALREGDRNRVLRLRWPFAPKEHAKVARVGKNSAPPSEHAAKETQLEKHGEEVLTETAAGHMDSRD
ncbi:chloride channel protein [Granulicella sibirica]|uniref:Chloride channel protein n=1 Tax=Granulicella sibirica TaxID=2479048 RepID=A0A4Q0SYZ7_9BACT|nr:chloride channel protein [Granulicella sibirica]RXH55652.1 Chloride channel protein [Granulicella sibirica]